MVRDFGLLARKYSQRGAAALPIGVLLLFVAALILIAVSRTASMEQRISANEIRSMQALQAAQAGIDRALAYMQTKGGIDKNNNKLADTNNGGDEGTNDVYDDDDFLVETLEIIEGIKKQYRFKYCNPASALGEDACPLEPGQPVCDNLVADNENPDALSSPLVLSCGWSDDNLAKKPIVVTSKLASFLKNAPDNPLVSKGTLNVSGSATVTNYYNNLTIWTGETFTSIGNSGKTFVRNPIGRDTPPTLPPPPSSCSTNDDYTCLTDKFTKGPDIIDNDLSLHNITADEMFYNFFGVDFGTYKNGIATRTISSDQVSSIEGAKDEAIVITGNTKLPDGKELGKPTQPVVIIIDGDWLGGNVTVNGILYVRGNAAVAGNPVINGALSVTGAMTGTGSLDVIFDPFSLGHASALGKAGVISGSWRDWL